MPRPKKYSHAHSTEEAIEKVSGEIASLQEQLKAKKLELKNLQRQKEAEDEKRILAAAKASGKSSEEIIRLIIGE